MFQNSQPTPTLWQRLDAAFTSDNSVRLSAIVCFLLFVLLSPSAARGASGPDVLAGVAIGSAPESLGKGWMQRVDTAVFWRLSTVLDVSNALVEVSTCGEEEVQMVNLTWLYSGHPLTSETLRAARQPFIPGEPHEHANSLLREMEADGWKHSQEGRAETWGEFTQIELTKGKMHRTMVFIAGSQNAIMHLTSRSEHCQAWDA